MPVEVKGKFATLICDACGKRSAPYRYTSPAAPELSACEIAEEDGWGYTIGFFAMLRGHSCWCPQCSMDNRGRVIGFRSPKNRC